MKMAFTAVGKRLLGRIYSKLKKSKPYRERIPIRYRVYDFL